MTHDPNGRVLHITVPGIPRPQPRPIMKRVSKTKLRAISVADPKAKLWRDGLIDAVRRALKAVGPGWLPRKGEALTASVVFRMPYGGGGNGRVGVVEHAGYLDIDQIAELVGAEVSQGNDGSGVTIELRVVPTDGYAMARPDIDNLLKMVMDGLQEAGALGELDDCALVEVSARKIKTR